jgi:hypothetical protein
MEVLVSPHAVPDSSDKATGATTSAPTSLPPRNRNRLGEQERLEQLDSMDLDALRAMAASMPVIEQAKGIVMGCYGVDPDTAFAVLRRVSSSGNLKLRALAVTVVEAASSQTNATQEPKSLPCEQVRRVIQARHVAAEHRDALSLLGTHAYAQAAASTIAADCRRRTATPDREDPQATPN